ncbi:MAG: protein phosphatase 2C domain-containing protein [Bacteroidota bacterium]
MNNNIMEISNNYMYAPVYLNEIGQRENNEDSIYPKNPSLHDRLFIVCDGVGGRSKGEVASALVCERFAEYINQHHKNHVSKAYFESGLKYVEEKMENYIKGNAEAFKMATTLTLLYFSTDYKAAYVIWIGDSRIYHIRNREILFQTKDHSEVQSLIDMGEITQLEAENHPRRNVITRAVSGASRPTRLDYKEISDVLSNDFFLLCTDGILENLNHQKINMWFDKDSNPEDIKNKIETHAYKNTRDNYSMYLLKMRNNNY